MEKEEWAKANGYFLVSNLDVSANSVSNYTNNCAHPLHTVLLGKVTGS